MNLKRDILKNLLVGGALAGCAVGFAIVRAPSWMTITASILALTLPAVNIILSVMIWRRDRLAPDLSFIEFGFLYEAWKAAKTGRPEVYADTPTQRRLVELGLIQVVRVKRPSPVGLPSPMGDITLTFSEITPLGRKVLVESVRKEEGEEAANAMVAWQPPGSAEKGSGLGLTRSLERTAAPLRSSRVVGFGDALWWSRVTGVITAGRLSLSSVVGRHDSDATTNTLATREGGTMNHKLLNTLLVFFTAGVWMSTHADEPLKVDTQGVTAKILYEAPIDGGHLPELLGKYKLRVTEVTIAPGGHVGDHNHLGPGIRQMTEGEMEYVLPDKTIIYRAGDFFFEAGDVSHRVNNKTEKPNTHLLLEILSTDVKGTSLIHPRDKTSQ